MGTRWACSRPCLISWETKGAGVLFSFLLSFIIFLSFSLLCSLPLSLHKRPISTSHALHGCLEVKSSADWPVGGELLLLNWCRSHSQHTTPAMWTRHATPIESQVISLFPRSRTPKDSLNDPTLTPYGCPIRMAPHDFSVDSLPMPCGKYGRGPMHD